MIWLVEHNVLLLLTIGGALEFEKAIFPSYTWRCKGLDLGLPA